MTYLMYNVQVSLATLLVPILIAEKKEPHTKA